jgi:hypothetical protein
MEVDSGPLESSLPPLPSSPPMATQNEPTLPRLPLHAFEYPSRVLLAPRNHGVELSSDPLNKGGDFTPEARATQQSRKRAPGSPGPSSLRTGHPPIQTHFQPPDLIDLFGTQASTLNTISPTQPSQAKEALLQARDLIVKAYSLTKDREEQTRVLDLLEIFREYIEKGTLRKTSSIISSQINNLERATRKIESKAKTLNQTPAPSQPQPQSQPLEPTSTLIAQNPPNRASFATIASRGVTSTQNQEWTTISPKAKAKPKESTRIKARDRRVILVQDLERLSDSPFSPIRLRNTINLAFQAKGVKEPVVATVSKTLAKNIVVTTTDSFSASYLLEKEALWAHLIPHQAILKDTSWFKVAVHGIPFSDFDTPTGMALVKEEISTFNVGLKPIGTPYWLTPLSRRQDPTQRAGTVALAFATEAEAKRAIQKRLYIAGISARVEKLYSLPPSTQCPKCQSYGHLENKCKQKLACALCSEEHHTRDHTCSQCKAKGSSCKHLTPKCSNCQGSHPATSLTCEIRKALKTTTL